MEKGNSIEESKRGEAPLSYSFPLSFEGEGDKGGEVARLIRHICISGEFVLCLK